MSEKSPPPSVSDHAVLRYLQRAHNVPVEAIRQQLAASAAIGIAHDAAVVSLGPVKLVIRDGAVVTCLRRGSKPRSERRRADRESDDA